MVWASFLACLSYADPHIGSKWTSFSLRDNGGRVTEWVPGEVTVISFCAYWCDTWKTQLPRLIEARKQTKGLPVRFLVVSIDGRWSEASKTNHEIPMWLDYGGDWSRKHGIDRVPTTVVLDSTGEVRFVGGGVVRTEDILGAIRQANETKSKSEQTLFLTFDDFPAGNGPELLDALRAQSIPATFFCIGSRVAENASMLKRAINEGHSLQSHSWSHNSSHPDLEKCRQIFRQVLGIEAKLYRPPGSEMIDGEAEHHPIVDPYDFQRPSRDELIRRIIGCVRDRAIIQLHANVKVTLEVLPELLDLLKRRGFVFKVL